MALPLASHFALTPVQDRFSYRFSKQDYHSFHSPIFRDPLLYRLHHDVLIAAGSLNFAIPQLHYLRGVFQSGQAMGDD